MILVLENESDDIMRTTQFESNLIERFQRSKYTNYSSQFEILSIKFNPFWQWVCHF